MDDATSGEMTGGETTGGEATGAEAGAAVEGAAAAGEEACAESRAQLSNRSAAKRNPLHCARVYTSGRRAWSMLKSCLLIYILVLLQFHNYCIRFRERAGLHACVQMQKHWAYRCCADTPILELL